MILSISRCLLLVTLATTTFCTTSWATEPAPASPLSARYKLDRLLRCDEEKKAAILQEQRTVQEHLRKVEAFRASLTDARKNRLSIDKAEQALAKDREALAKLEERLTLVNRKLALTARAIQNLLPEQGGDARSMTDDLTRSATTRFANATRCGQPGDATYVTDQTRLALFATDDDVCSRQLDEVWGTQYGYVDDPATEARLKGILAHLQARSSRNDLPLAVRIVKGCPGVGAAASSMTIYFEQCELKKTLSDDELTFIAAHELAHVQLSHSNQYQIQEKVERKLSPVDLDQLVPQDARVAHATKMPDKVGQAWMSRFNKTQELEADLLGAQMAMAAGVSPLGIQETFTRIARERDEDERIRLAAMTGKQRAVDATNTVRRELDRLTDTHPEPEERLKALENALGEKFWERTDLKLGDFCFR
jgi:Peptidase family M48